MSKRYFIFFIASLLLVFPSCASLSGNTTKVIRPRTHHRMYDPKRDKRKKKTKVVRMKS